MPRFKSILARIVWLHVVAVCVTSVAVPFAAYLLLKSTAQDHQGQRLLRHVDIIAAHLGTTPDGGWTLDLPTDRQVLYARGNSGFYFSIVDEAGRAVFSSLPDKAVIFPSDPRDQDVRFFSRERGMATYSGVSAPQRRGDKTVWIEVAQDLNSPDAIMDDVVRNFLYRVGWITIPILLVLLAIDIYIVRRALRPVREASQLASAIEPARIELRLPTKDMPGEVLPLVNAVNQALDRLESGFRAQREFSADAAHELRTPLAVLRARIDLLADKGAVGELRTSIEAMSRIVNQLLEIADLESFAVDPNDVADLQNVAAEVVGYIAPVALAQGKDIALTGAPGPVWVKGDAEALFQAVRNVVENAVKHTAPGTTVEVDVDAKGTVRVLDRGPGVAENERELIFRRFWRGDRRHVGSAGLGLSIVARIVEAHAGNVTVGNRAGGGAVFALSFVVAPSPATPAVARPPQPVPLPSIARLPHAARLRR